MLPQFRVSVTQLQKRRILSEIGYSSNKREWPNNCKGICKEQSMKLFGDNNFLRSRCVLSRDNNILKDLLSNHLWHDPSQDFFKATPCLNSHCVQNPKSFNPFCPATKLCGLEQSVDLSFFFTFSFFNDTLSCAFKNNSKKGCWTDQIIIQGNRHYVHSGMPQPELCT